MATAKKKTASSASKKKASPKAPSKTASKPVKTSAKTSTKASAPPSAKANKAPAKSEDKMEAKAGNGLTLSQSREFLQILQEKRDELRRSIEARKSRDSAIDPSEIIEELEQASAGQQQDVALRILDKEVKLLREVERALKKFESDEFGLCEGTLDPIGYARLKARPWARYSVTHKEELERLQREQSVLRPGR